MTASVLRRCQAPKCKVMFDLDTGDKTGLCTYHLRERVKDLEHQLDPRALNAVQAEKLLAERVRDMQLELAAQAEAITNLVEEKHDAIREMRKAQQESLGKLLVENENAELRKQHEVDLLAEGVLREQLAARPVTTLSEDLKGRALFRCPDCTNVFRVTCPACESPCYDPQT